MRSTSATLLLAILAIALCGVAGVQLSQSNLHSLFGAPPLPPDTPLHEFELDSVARLHITNSSGATATFSWQNSHWRMDTPTTDRADYRHLQSLVLATRTLRVRDAIARDELDPEQAGLQAGRFEIKLDAVDGRCLAHFTLGRVTPWHVPVGEEGTLAETFFVAPADRSDIVYICSGPNARPLLEAGFEVLRDHRPFLFSGAALSEIIIRDKKNELVVARDTLLSAWRVKKPLDLRADPEAVARLVKGLYDLKALRIHDPGSITLPTPANAGTQLAITLNFKDSNGTDAAGPTLAVEPPATPESNTAFARVSDRTAVFELPLNPSEGHVALSELPTGIDDLRSRTLSSPDLITELRSVSIEAPDLMAPLVISLGKERMTGQPRWMVEYGPGLLPANEPAVARLFTALTIDRIKSFATDAADDLAPYGLDEPAKRVVITRGKDAPRTTVVLFGASPDGRYFAMRDGSSTVAEIDYGTWSNIEAQPFAWRDSILWPQSLIDLQKLRIERPGEPGLDLSYDFISETWAASENGRDITSSLNTRRATILLDNLEQVHVSRWLGPDSQDARLRLENPSLTIEGIYRSVDEEGNPGPPRRSLVDFAPASDSPRNQLYYGRLSGDLDYFVIPKSSYDLLDVRLLDE